jgi:hypothetical protein
VGQEYFINSQQLQDKVADLLPSQGGAGSGFDLSASTQIVPVINLTESAEGSNLREDLQSSLSHNSVTPFSVTNTTTTIVNNTGYFRIFGNVSLTIGGSVRSSSFILNDGSTDKTIWETSTVAISSTNSLPNPNFDFIVFLGAGDSLKVTSTTLSIATGCSRQIADISGSLVNPN